MKDNEIYKKRTQRDYSFSFKLQVVQEVEKGESSVTGAQRKYGIQGRSTVVNWLRKYGNFEKRLREMGGKSLTQEIADLRAKLRVLEDEKEIWHAVFDIIKDEYGEEVVKKYMPESLRESLKKQQKKKK